MNGGEGVMSGSAMSDLFDRPDGAAPERQELAPGAVLLRGWALPVETQVLVAIDEVAVRAPFRHMVTPGGFQMSVAMTNCGSAGWISDRRGYRYVPRDPGSGRPWPPMSEVFRGLAAGAAKAAGFPGFEPDSCLINRYVPGARLSLHQDRDEKDFDNPIVSVSLGLSATFQFGGTRRNDPPAKLLLYHGDVVVWGGAARLAHHGTLALKEGEHPATGRRRLNLPFRRAL